MGLKWIEATFILHMIQLFTVVESCQSIFYTDYMMGNLTLTSLSHSWYTHFLSLALSNALLMCTLDFSALSLRFHPSMHWCLFLGSNSRDIDEGVYCWCCFRHLLYVLQYVSHVHFVQMMSHMYLNIVLLCGCVLLWRSFFYSHWLKWDILCWTVKSCWTSRPRSTHALLQWTRPPKHQKLQGRRPVGYNSTAQLVETDRLRKTKREIFGFRTRRRANVSCSSANSSLMATDVWKLSPWSFSMCSKR